MQDDKYLYFILSKIFYLKYNIIEANSMKIGHITFGLTNGGKENMLVDIANEQSRQGHKVAIVIVNKRLEESIIKRIDSFVQVFTINRNPGSRNITPWINLFLILNFRFRSDILHCHDVNLGKLCRLLSAVPRVLTIHGPGIECKSMNYYKKLFAISNSVKLDIEQRSDFRCIVIFNGINTEMIKQKVLGKSKGCFKIVLVKRLNHERKGQDLLIKAAARLVYQMNLKNIHIDFIGDGSSRSYLEEMIHEFDLSEYISFQGNKSRQWVYENLHNYDIFVHPSRYEGFGLAVAEAMAAKVPVIASNIEGPAEILENGKYGFMFENNNVDDLSNKIIDVINLYKAGKIDQMIERAYKHCLAKFDIKATAHNYSLSYF